MSKEFNNNESTYFMITLTIQRQFEQIFMINCTTYI